MRDDDVSISSDTSKQSLFDQFQAEAEVLEEVQAKLQAIKQEIKQEIQSITAPAEAAVAAEAAQAAVAAAAAAAAVPAPKSASVKVAAKTATDEEAFMECMRGFGKAYRNKKKGTTGSRVFCPSWPDIILGGFKNVVILVSRDLKCLLRDNETELKKAGKYSIYDGIQKEFNALLKISIEGTTNDKWFMPKFSERSVLMVAMCNVMHNEIKLNPLLSVTNGSLQITAKNTREESDYWKRECITVLFPHFECKLT